MTSSQVERLLSFSVEMLTLAGSHSSVQHSRGLHRLSGWYSDGISKKETAMQITFSSFLLKNEHIITRSHNSNSFFVANTDSNGVAQCGWQVNQEAGECHLSTARSACAEEQLSADWRQNKESDEL